MIAPLIPLSTGKTIRRALQRRNLLDDNIMKIVDRESSQKLYLQLADILRQAIESGELSVGEQLPTEDQLCARQGVSKAVVRAAMQDLARKGYVRKIPGKGTFVEKPVGASGVWLYGRLSENLLDFGADWETEVIQKMLSVAPSDLAELFTLEANKQVFKVLRLRRIDGAPVALDTGYVSHGLCPGLPLEDLRANSLIDIIHEKYGIPIVRCADSLEVTTLEDREAELLKRDPGDSALLADRILYTTNNRVVAFLRHISVSESHRVTFESVRTPGGG